jgi:hypothetical protein
MTGASFYQSKYKTDSAAKFDIVAGLFQAFAQMMTIRGIYNNATLPYSFSTPPTRK